MYVFIDLETAKVIRFGKLFCFGFQKSFPFWITFYRLQRYEISLIRYHVYCKKNLKSVTFFQDSEMFTKVPSFLTRAYIYYMYHMLLLYVSHAPVIFITCFRRLFPMSRQQMSLFLLVLSNLFSLSRSDRALVTRRPALGHALTSLWSD